MACWRLHSQSATNRGLSFGNYEDRVGPRMGKDAARIQMESLFNEHAYRAAPNVPTFPAGSFSSPRSATVYHVRIRVIVSLVRTAGTVYQHTDVQTSTSILLWSKQRKRKYRRAPSPIPTTCFSPAAAAVGYPACRHTDRAHCIALLYGGARCANGAHGVADPRLDTPSPLLLLLLLHLVQN